MHKFTNLAWQIPANNSQNKVKLEYLFLLRSFWDKESGQHNLLTFKSTKSIKFFLCKDMPTKPTIQHLI